MKLQSQVYTDTFKNKPYSVSMFETTDVTTPDLREYPHSDFYESAMKCRHARKVIHKRNGAE